MLAQVDLFRSVLTRLCETSSSAAIQRLSLFQRASEQSGHPETADVLIARVFDDFPSASDNVLQALAGMSACNPAAIVKYLCTVFTQCFEDDRNNPFSYNLAISPEYNSNRSEHRQCLFYSSILFLSALIRRVLETQNPRSAIPDTARVAIRIATNHTKISLLREKIIAMWSITISRLVRHGGIADVCQVFDTLVQSDLVELAFELVQYVDIGAIGFDKFKRSILGVLATTPVSGNLPVFVAHLISNCDSDRDFLGALVEVTKHETLIETGAKALLEGGLTQEFFEGRILEYREHTVLAFICAIAGPKVPIQFLSGTNAFDAAALQPRGKIFADDFSFLINGFLNSILPTITRNWDLVKPFFVLTWLDFTAFTEKIAPKMLEFESDDPRFIILLKSLPFINELGLAGTKDFNTLFRDRVLSLLNTFPSGSTERPVLS
jgi:hypothetical protein